MELNGFIYNLEQFMIGGLMVYIEVAEWEGLGFDPW